MASISLLLAVGIVSSYVALTSASTQSARIVNGNKPDENKYPWHASIQSIGLNEEMKCIGSIISEEWILTAAQCLRGYDNFTIALGSIYFDNPQLVIFSDVAVIHPNYKGTLSSDVGLIRLSMPLQFSESIASVRLPNKSHTAVSFEGSKTRISGWGYTSKPNNSAENVPEFLWIELTVISNSKCARSYGSLITDSVICAENLKGANICENDYGGALVIKEDGEWLQIGIASYIQNCSTEGPSAYGRVPTFVDWVKQETGIIKTV